MKYIKILICFSILTANSISSMDLIRSGLLEIQNSRKCKIAATIIIFSGIALLAKRFINNRTNSTAFNGLLSKLENGDPEATARLNKALKCIQKSLKEFNDRQQEEDQMKNLLSNDKK